MEQPKLLILEFGSQVTMLIERGLREKGFRSAILPLKKAEDWVKTNEVKGIILSGSFHSVHDEDAPKIPDWVFKLNVPLLGICYGMQLLVHMLDGEVTKTSKKEQYRHKEYGKVIVTFRPHPLFQNLHSNIVWASHSDTVTRLPLGFHTIANSPDNQFLAVSDREGKRLGVLFHPEMVETIAGREILENFASICGCKPDWEPKDSAEEAAEEVLQELGPHGKAVIGVSGGVDSTTLAKILYQKLGDRLLPFCIDTGSLRAGELEEIKRNFDLAQIPFNLVRAENDFLPVIQRYIDAEEKRNIFLQIYRGIGQNVAIRFGTDKFIQASIAPDFIETGQRDGEVIKTHHNIFPGIHPFRNLFKYEVRAISRSLGLPPEITERQPFPGPGLFVRCVGLPATPHNVEIVRQSDKTVTQITKESGDYEKMSQLVAAGLGVNIVGVKGDGRSYKPPIVVRGLITSDFMTGIGYQLPADVRREITDTLGKDPEISTALFDESHKPPRTTEFE